jgi:sugar lactone lactonase YvrE
MSEIVIRDVETLAEGLTLTEGPRWHDGRLYFSDMYAHRVCALDERGRLETIAAFEDRTSGLGFLPGGDMLVVLMSSARLMRVGKSGPTLHADLRRFASHDINDMVVTSSGRAYVGQLGFDAEKGVERKPTTLITVDPSGAAAIAADNLGCPNGLAVTADGRTLIIAESTMNRLSAFDLDGSGRLGNRRIFARLPGERQGPDGFCLDDRGGAWVAIPFNLDEGSSTSPGFIRVEEGGRVTHRVPVEEGRKAIACVFGGAGRDHLYLCTCAESDADGARRARGGRIERVSVGFKGAGTP